MRSNKLRGTTLAAAALVVALLAGVAAYAIPERGNQRSVVTAAHVRWELARTSLRMTASSPWFGVGIGRYYSRSGEFSSPELLASFPPAVHENAHNNFLQVLAELGIVGFAIVLWLLVSGRSLRPPASGGRPARSAAVERRNRTPGLRAVVAGGSPAPHRRTLIRVLAAPGRPRRLGRVASTRVRAGSPSRMGGAGCGHPRAVSVPVRADRQKADFDLEHRGVGLSTWHDAIDGVRYRVAGSSSSVFLPADVQMVVVPLRAVGPPAKWARAAARWPARRRHHRPADRWHSCG